MDAKLLTENGWKATAAKLKIKDNGLQRALADYEELDKNEHENCLKSLAAVSQFATALRKSREVATNPAAAKYLADICEAASSEKGDVTKAKAAAEKAAVVSQKKAQADAKHKEEDEEEDDSGDYSAKLHAVFQKLKGAKNVSYEFVVCDAKPIGLMVAKKITAQHKAALTELTGSTRFLPVGRCSFEDGKFSFTLDKPVPGLARKLQASIKNYTGKQLPILAGTESADDEEGQDTGEDEQTPQPVAPPKLGKAELHMAPNVWHSTRDILDKNVEAYKQAVMKAVDAEHPDLVKRVNQNLEKLDRIMDELDTELADSLTKAYASKDESTRKTELKNSKRILGDYIKYVKTEPLIAHIDGNPFGVQTHLKKILVDSLTHMAQAIG